MPRTLLLADDSVTIQKVVGLSFANEDVVLVTVSNGDDAIARARELRPDLVLADVVMPGRNGYEVCEAIRTDPALRHIPVLLLTGTFEAFDQERARRAGADGHVTKPFEAQALVAQVKELMARPAPAPPPAFEAPQESADTDPFLDDPLAGAPVLAEPLPFDAEAAEGELELATVAEEESPHDLFAAEDLAPLDAPEPPASSFDPGQETFRGTPLFGPGPSDAPPAAAPAFAPAAPPVFPRDAEPVLAREPEPDFATHVETRFKPVDEQVFGAAPEAAFVPSPQPSFAAASFDKSDTDAFSPRAAAPAPADLLPEDDDFDLGFDDAPFPVAEPRTERAPLAEPGRFGEDDPSADTVLDSGHAAGYDLSFDDLDDPLEATRGRLAGDVTPPPAAPVQESFPPVDTRPEGSTATVVATATAAATAGALPDLTPALRERLHDTLEKIAWEAFADLSDTIVRQAIERVEAIAWEVIPQLAEQLVREEIRRMKGD